MTWVDVRDVDLAVPPLRQNTYPLVLDVQVILAHVVEKGTGVSGVEKRKGNTAVVRPQEDVQQKTTTDGIGDVCVGSAFRQI